MLENKIIKSHCGYDITEKDMELAKYKYFLEQSLNMLYEVSYRYEEYKTNKPLFTNDTGTRKEFRNRLKQILDKVFNVVENEAEDGYPINWGKDFDGLVLLDYLDDPHSGDCTKNCWSCSRCYVESLIGCKTNIDNTKYIPKEGT